MENIVVYSGTDCPKCTTLKNKLDSIGISYTEINIREDEEALQELRDAGFRGIPVVKDNGEWVIDNNKWMKNNYD